MTDRTHPDSGRIITSSDILLHDAETALMYEELRAAIDDGHESMTHADALAEVAAMRAENIKLRAQLEAVGAGGVSGPLMGIAAPPTAQAEGWTRLPGALPEPGTPVLLDIGKKYPIRAMWAAKHTVQAADDDTDWGEYVEADDMYYAPEGWYEWNQCEDNHWRVTETPRAWMPLPPTSAEGWSMGERSNPNNCASCRHKQNPDGGHCYMFRFEPTEMCAQHTRIAELESELEAVGAGGVQPLRKCLHHIEEPLEKVLERREAVIQILERDAHEAHQRAAHALGTRKVLWNLLGECSPLLHQLECNDHESEEQLNSLLRRIDDARAVVQVEELPNARP